MGGKSLNTSFLQWVIDSGASHHMTLHIDVLDDVDALSDPIPIAQPDSKIVAVKKTGTVSLGDHLILKEVLYTPTFKCNLISVQKLANDENCLIIYGVHFCALQDLTSRKLIQLKCGMGCTV